MAKKEKSISGYPEGLKESLIDLPHIKIVYIKGNEWHFVKKKGSHEVDRNDIINEQ